MVESKVRVLLVDGDQNIHLKTGHPLGDVTRTRFEVDCASSPQAALEAIASGRHDIALVHDRSADHDGSDLVRQAACNGFAIPLILLTRRSDEIDDERAEVRATLVQPAAATVHNAEMFEELKRSYADLAFGYEETIEGWARVVDMRDHESEGHSRRVSEMTTRLARALGVSETEMIHLRRGALLHDIGKFSIPENILLKQGPLTETEWAIMRRHPETAVQMLAPVSFLHPAVDIPYCHHERWDGAGYPRGLKGDEIPLSARIFATVDVWDALSNDRPYRRAWTPAKIHEHLASLAGSHLDPTVVTAFLRIVVPVNPSLQPQANNLEAERNGVDCENSPPATLGFPAPSWDETAARSAVSCESAIGRVVQERLTILAVDDDPAASRALSVVLESMGHNVLAASSAEEAWSILQQGDIRLVIADLVMPEVDGLELCRRIRARDGSPYTYILLVTTRNRQEDRLEGLAAGADDFLAKPLSPAELTARLEIARRILSMQAALISRSVQAERLHAELRRQNERLAELVATDPLTGLANRRHLVETLESASSLAQRYAQPLSLIMLDVDWFKRYNDTFGHRAGDDILGRFADLLRHGVRAHDLVARYGGEEFVILLPSTDAEAARFVAERLRGTIESAPWPLDRLTASFGVASLNLGDRDYLGLIDRADLALYAAKRSGRNRVILHDDPETEHLMSIAGAEVA
jgi:diguanylate cyclase (GGDEF)-like protein